MKKISFYNRLPLLLTTGGMCVDAHAWAALCTSGRNGNVPGLGARLLKYDQLVVG